MKLSTRGRYAVMAMVDLAARGEGPEEAEGLSRLSSRTKYEPASAHRLFSSTRHERTMPVNKAWVLSLSAVGVIAVLLTIARLVDA